MPKISIIVPVYNVEKYIKYTIDSIKNQSFKDFECILINDGSTDNSLQVINDKIKDDKRFKVLSFNNYGQASARNKGITKANGDYICFIDSDDKVASDYLEVLYNNAINYDADLSVSNFEYIDSLDELVMGRALTSRIYKKDEFLNAFLTRNIQFLITSVLVKKETIINNKLYFDENIKFSEDQMYLWDLIINSNKIVYSDKKLYGYYLRENSIMTSTKKDKILASYPYIKDKLSSFDYIKYPYLKSALSRWKLGLLHACAKLMNYKDFIDVYNNINGDDIKRELNGLNDKKTNILSSLLSFSKHLFYIASRVA